MAIYYVSPAGAGASTGGTWANALGMNGFHSVCSEIADSTDIFYVKGGTYTLTSNWTAGGRDGSQSAPITIIGVNSTTTNEPAVAADWADGDERPTIAAAAFDFIFDNYWIIRNIKVTTTDLYGFRVDTRSLITNCKSNNSSGAGGRLGIGVYGTDTSVIDCESQSASGIGIHMVQFDCMTMGCYIHDSVTGIEGYADSSYLFNIIDTITSCGLSFITSGPMNTVKTINNTFYKCSIGISASTDFNFIVMNNIFMSCVSAISWAVEQDTNYFDYNNYFENITDVNNVTKGNNATAVDPQFTNAAGGDFSMNAASGCIGAAFSIEEGVG